METSIKGLLTQKATSPVPQLGQTRRFSLIERVGKTGKPWTKIKSEGEGYGDLYRIMGVVKTDYTDDHGNVSYQVELDAAPTQQPPAPRSFSEAGGGDRSSRIERQHSQEMALRYFAQRPEILKATESAEQAAKLIREMTSWFQRDISRSPEKQAEQPEDPTESSEALAKEEEPY